MNKRFLREFYERQGRETPLGGQYEPANRLLYGAGVLLCFTRRLENVISLLPKDITGKRVLDIGAGIGVYSMNLARRGARTISIDISTVYLEKTRVLCRENEVETHTVNGDLCSLPFKGSAFDVVLVLEVLEHVQDYRRALREVRRVAGVEGVVIVSFPSKWSCKEFSDRVKSRIKTLFLRLQGESDVAFSQHIHFFSPAAMTETLRENGFIVQDTRIVVDFLYHLLNPFMGKNTVFDMLVNRAEYALSFIPLLSFVSWNVTYLCTIHKDKP